MSAAPDAVAALLDGHPWFRVTSLVASPRSAGKRYADAVDWRLEGEVPDPLVAGGPWRQR